MGISASLTPEAMAIWNTIPKKEAGEKPIYNNNNQGRSYWLSQVIIQHEGWVENYNNLLREKHDLENDLLRCSHTLNELQKKVNE